MRFHLLSISILVFLANLQTSVCVIDLLGNLLQTFKEFMLPPSDLIKDTTEFDEFYDFIIVGAGSAGCVLANRLTEVPEWKVLLLEAGKDETQLTDIPATAAMWMMSEFSWPYTTEPQEQFCLSNFQHRCMWPRGKAMGGSSTTNFMLYTRGHPKDYDEWEALGNPGWGWKDLFPYFLKMERVEIPELMNSPYRGKNGYQAINHVPWRTPLGKTFLEAGEELGFKVTDPNGEQMIGFSYSQTTTKDGRRFSAAKGYIRPIRFRNNLFVAKEARVTKILIDPSTKTAQGVEFIKGLKTHIVKANKEVIISAGALNTPQLLMLSGIGPAKHLTELGIPVLNDLHVGQNLQDHVTINPITFFINDTISMVGPRVATNPQNAVDYAVHYTGPFTSQLVESIAFVNSKALNSDVLNNPMYDVPDLEILLGNGPMSMDLFNLDTARETLGSAEALPQAIIQTITGKDGVSIGPVLLKPKSRGYMLLRSTNPLDPPMLYANYFSEREDMEKMIAGVKFSIKIGESKSFAKYDTHLQPDPYPACSHIPFGTDDYWECGIRHISASLFHPTGTCKMGPKTDPTAVVDHELKVYGLNKLRVVDCSIIPIIPATHTNSVAMTIGEKAADMIKKTWA